MRIVVGVGVGVGVGGGDGKMSLYGIRVFRCRTTLSLREYIHTILDLVDMDASVQTAMAMYMSRYLRKIDCATIPADCIQGLVATATLIAVKYWDDECTWNADLTNIFDILLQPLNRMEMRFLQTVDYRLGITQTEYDDFLLSVQDDATYVPFKELLQLLLMKGRTHTPAPPPP
jgi:hypothetical protein